MDIDKSIIGEIRGVIVKLLEDKITIKLKDEFVLDIPRNVFKLIEKSLVSGTKIIYQIKETTDKVKYQEIIEDSGKNPSDDTDSKVIKEFLDSK